MAAQSQKVTPLELLRIREKQWSGKLCGCSLVAELQVKEQHSRQVAQVLGYVYGNWKRAAKAERLFQNWPACVAVSLTGIAARDYRQGELWPRIWEGLGSHGDQQDREMWGSGFLAALARLGLPAFPELPMPFVGPILMHTGIPNYCLEDYFRLISQRRAVDPGLDAEGFMAWATGREHRLDVLDKPARRFLEHGTDYALDFVDRTFDLLDRLRAPSPDLDGVGLPPRVMIRAQELADEGRLDLRPPRGGSSGRTHTERPRIGLDPFGRGIEVILPAVGDTSDGLARWSVTADGVTTTVRSQAHWAELSEAAPSTPFPLLKPVRTVVVAMAGWGHQVELPVIDPGAPLLVFTEDGRRLPANLPLPPDMVWVVYPAEHELEADGSFQVTVEGQLPLGWNGWRLQQISLHEARSLRLAGVPASNRPVRGFTRPRIMTPKPVPAVTTPYGSAVHAQAPQVWLPGVAGAQTTWTVEIRTVGGKAVVSQTHTVTEETTLTGLWGELPGPLLGSFELVVRGPLGRGVSRRVFLAEGLVVQCTPRVRMFGPAGLTGTRAELRTAIGARANPRVLSFGPGERAIVVEYRTDQESVSLVITPPHLQVMHERAGQSPAWRAGPLQIPADVFTDGPGTLLVHLPEPKTVPSLQVMAGGRAVQDVPPSGRPQQGTGRYDLTRIADTVAEHHRAELVLELGTPVRVASVRPRKFASLVERAADRLQLVDFVPVEGLIAGVYARNAPWREPLRMPVTDDGLISLPPELRQAGPLRVALQIDDPWVPVEWPRWPEQCLLVAGDGHLVSEDPQETALSRFLAEEGEFPEDIDDLRKVWTLIELAQQLWIASDVQLFLRACTRPIRRRPSEAITALADLGLEPDRLVSAVVASGLAATTVPEPDAEAARKLWPVAPLLGALAGGLSDPDCLDAAERQCGDCLPEILGSRKDPHAAVGRFGPEVERMRHMTPEQLEGIWRAAQVVPRALLDADTRAAAARRLFDHRTQENVRQFSRMATSVVRTALALLKDWPHLSAQVEARRHPEGNGGWLGVPAASTALAIIARLAAYGDERCHGAEQLYRADWTRLAAQAPDLVTIDLILAELLIGPLPVEAL
jgi:hypothetical protein